MTKDEMVTLLRSVGCDENTITAMTNAYEMGFEQGADVGKHLRAAVEAGRDVCKYLSHDMVQEAKDHVSFFWDAIDQIQDGE